MQETSYSTLATKYVQKNEIVIKKKYISMYLSKKNLENYCVHIVIYYHIQDKLNMLPNAVSADEINLNAAKWHPLMYM